MNFNEILAFYFERKAERFLGSPESKMREEAILCLRGNGRLKARSLLSYVLKDADLSLRELAAEFLAEVGDPAGVSTLVAALQVSIPRMHRGFLAHWTPRYPGEPIMGDTSESRAQTLLQSLQAVLLGGSGQTPDRDLILISALKDDVGPGHCQENRCIIRLLARQELANRWGLGEAPWPKDGTEIAETYHSSDCSIMTSKVAMPWRVGTGAIRYSCLWRAKCPKCGEVTIPLPVDCEGETFRCHYCLAEGIVKRFDGPNNRPPGIALVPF